MSSEFQSLSSKQGKEGEDMAAERLKKFGFTSIKRNGVLPGVEVNITATNKRGVRMYFAVAASWRGKVPGLKRTDTFKKAVCDCLMVYLNTGTPGIVIASHKPDPGRGQDILKTVPRNILLDVIDLEGDDEMWEFLATAIRDDIDQLIEIPRDLGASSNNLQLGFGF